ncbi:hypothetical protein [Haloglomus litoreum]|uniref:hypothetical protein n=1 Tax=Haloglomus litoreum TaxID=3034026 RepID=UPI0023E7FF53|nr:hypothetical protein [Haloglomus sp. DT116]
MAELFGIQVTDAVTLLIVIFGGAILVLAARYIAAYLNAPESTDDRFEWATNRTARWLGMIAGGVITAGGIAIIQGVDIVAMLTQFIGSHPFIVSNLAGIGLGAGVLSGTIRLTVDQYVGIALMAVAGTFLLSEVYGDAS